MVEPPVVEAFRPERERVRNFATLAVTVALAALGGGLIIFAIVLPVRGGLGFIFLSLFIAAIGAVVLLGALFFQLVPFRLEELAGEKRAYDRRSSAPDGEPRSSTSEGDHRSSAPEGDRRPRR
ncbi:MAG: hypothetical protein ACYDCK_13165 [Thermoplasmatota archaeon]